MFAQYLLLFWNTLYNTQMAASMIKALFERISVAVHFPTGHVKRESFNFLKIWFPWELLNFEVNFGNIGVLWTWKALEKKHRVSNQTNKLSPNTATQGNDMPRKISITNVQCHQRLTDLGCCTSLSQTSLGCCTILLEQHILKFALGFLIQCWTCLSKIVNPQITGFFIEIRFASIKRETNAVGLLETIKFMRLLLST